MLQSSFSSAVAGDFVWPAHSLHLNAFPGCTWVHTIHTSLAGWAHRLTLMPRLLGGKKWSNPVTANATNLHFTQHKYTIMACLWWRDNPKRISYNMLSWKKENTLDVYVTEKAREIVSGERNSVCRPAALSHTTAAAVNQELQWHCLFQENIQCPKHFSTKHTEIWPAQCGVNENYLLFSEVSQPQQWTIARTILCITFQSCTTFPKC